MNNDFPVVDSVGIVKLRSGWVVVAISSEGPTIITSDVVFGPGELRHASEALTTAAAELGARKGAKREYDA